MAGVNVERITAKVSKLKNAVFNNGVVVATITEKKRIDENTTEKTITTKESEFNTIANNNRLVAFGVELTQKANKENSENPNFDNAGKLVFLAQSTYNIAKRDLKESMPKQ